ncbi:MAG: type II toxin-antitoxin system RelE/ParE family toxin [Candidatus Nitrotoga sp.]
METDDNSRAGRCRNSDTCQNEYRIIYIAKFEEAIYVLHGFTKKTQQTSKRDIDLAAKRYRELHQERTKK